MKKIKILFLAANPSQTAHLALGKEIREIEDKIRGSRFQKNIELISKFAVRPDDLLQYLNQHMPDIVHFSGHGSQTQEIILCDNDNNPKPVSKAALSSLFDALTDNIRLVLLNACFSRPQAEAITEHVECAIGMKVEIGDNAAITFASSFYRAIAYGRSIKNAFKQGKAALLLEDIPESDTPELLLQSGVDPSMVILLRPSSSNVS